MSFSHTVTSLFTGSNTSGLSAAVTETGTGEDHRTIILTDSTDGQEVDISWTNSKLQSLFLLSTRAVTIFSNVDGGAGNSTVALTANVPVVYQVHGGQVNPFITADVTKLYMDNASGGSATVEIRVLVHPSEVAVTW